MHHPGATVNRLLLIKTTNCHPYFGAPTGGYAETAAPEELLPSREVKSRSGAQAPPEASAPSVREQSTPPCPTPSPAWNVESGAANKRYQRGCPLLPLGGWAHPAPPRKPPSPSALATPHTLSPPSTFPPLDKHACARGAHVYLRACPKAIFPRAAKVNHGCRPNVAFSTQILPGRLVYTAIRPIRCGEEVRPPARVRQ